MTPEWLASVTAREAEVLAGIRAHQTNQQVAEQLFVSVRTVESHVASLLRKSGAADRRELARLAEGLDHTPAVIGLQTFATTFLGRDEALDELAVRMEKGRIVTVVGPGGVGKTRLAHEVLARLARSWELAAAVDLLPVHSGDVASAVAETLGVPEEAGVPARTALSRALGDRRAVLLLDNCEHLSAEVADLVAAVHATCGRATALATSREPLRLPGENVMELSPLAADTGAALRLFCDRSGLDPALDVAEVVALLEGVPLSIELAAARAPTLGIEGLRAGLHGRLPALSGGRDPDLRHRSAAATVAWSLALLDRDERDLLRSMAALHHPVDLDTAAAVHGTSPEETALLLSELAAKSLLQMHRTERPTRWSMLDLVRRFAGERQPSATASKRVATWAAERARRLLDHHAGPARELTDLLHAALDTPTGPDPAAHGLLRDVAVLALRAGRLTDALECLAAAADRAPDPRSAVGDLLEAAAVAAAQASTDATHRLLVKAGDRAETAGDRVSHSRALAAAVVAWYRYPPPSAEPGPGGVPVDDVLALAVAEAGDEPEDGAALSAAIAWHDGGRAAAEGAVAAAEKTRDPIQVAAALDALTTACIAEQGLRAARAAALRRVELLRAQPHATPRGLEEAVDALHAAASTALIVGRPLQARGLEAEGAGPTQDGQELPREIRALTLLGRLDEATAAAETMWRRWLADGCPPRTWMSTAGAFAVLAAGLAAGLAGNPSGESVWRERTLRLAGVGVADHAPTLAAVSAYVDARLALHRLALHRGDLTNVGYLVDRSQQAFVDRQYEGFARAAGAELAVAAGHPDAAALVDSLASPARESDWVQAVRERCLARLQPVSEYGPRALAIWRELGATFEADATVRLVEGVESAVRRSGG